MREDKNIERFLAQGNHSQSSRCHEEIANFLKMSRKKEIEVINSGSYILCYILHFMVQYVRNLSDTSEKWLVCEVKIENEKQAHNLKLGTIENT